MLLMGLCVIQPLLDILSFWMQNVSWGNTLTTLVRSAILAAVLLCAFCITDKKRVYLIAAGLFAAFYAAHLYAFYVSSTPMTAGGVLDDFANYVRVIQLPLLTMAFITFVSKCDDGFEHIQKGLLAAFVIIAVTEVLSALSGTNPYTYPNKQIGLLGWFYFANSQSAILSMLFPFVLCYALCKDKLWIAAVICIIGFGELYLFATRLAYLAIFVIAAGTLFTWFVCRRLKLKNAVIIIVCAALCAASFTVSPMYENQRLVQKNAAIKQQEIDELTQKGIEEFGKDDYKHLTYAYDAYLGGLVEEFGLERVAQLYDYSTDVGSVADVRAKKINYCILLQEDNPLACRVFGLPYGSMTSNGNVFDVENDLHGLYFLYGWVGLAVFCLFILWFAFIVIMALIKNAKMYFTVEAGACGIAVCTGLIHAYYTAGVLRRPNASFYLSLSLALIWYLIFVKHYNDNKGEIN